MDNIDYFVNDFIYRLKSNLLILGLGCRGVWGFFLFVSLGFNLSGFGVVCFRFCGPGLSFNLGLVFFVGVSVPGLGLQWFSLKG